MAHFEEVETGKDFDAFDIRPQLQKAFGNFQKLRHQQASVR